MKSAQLKVCPFLLSWVLFSVLHAIAQAPQPPLLCSSITIPYLGMDHFLLSLFLDLLYSYPGETAVSGSASSQAFIIIRHEIVVIAASWQEFLIILCSHLPLIPLAFTETF